MLDVLIENWGVILLALIPIAQVIVRLTPTEKDNNILDLILKFVPNFKKGGGTF